MLLGISPVKLLPPRQRTRNSVIFPLFSGKRPEKPSPFIEHPKMNCRLISFTMSFGISPLMEVVLNEMMSCLLMLPNRKSPMRPRSLGFPSVQRENKFRIFQNVRRKKTIQIVIRQHDTFYVWRVAMTGDSIPETMRDLISWTVPSTSLLPLLSVCRFVYIL